MNILLVGRGWVGHKMYSELTKRGHSVTFEPHNPAFYALKTQQFDWCINAAGYTGVPNVDACELDKLSTYQANATYPIKLYEACKLVGVRFAHFSSGCIYEGEINSVDANPNFFGSSYSISKGITDKYLKSKAHVYRIRMPFTTIDEPKNYLTKVINYANTGKLYEGGLNSLTYLDDAITVSCNLMEDGASNGPYNLVNSGAVTMNDIARILKLSPQWYTAEEFSSVTLCKRSNCVIPPHPQMPSVLDRLELAASYLLDNSQQTV
jgi:dTDP-4-dehydrorhamnose reductase